MSTTAFSDAQLSIKQLGGLSVAHHDTLIRAMENVFSTELAEVTMSQLIDGLILPDVMYEARAHPGFPGHPIHSHTELCGGAREKFRLLRANFDVEGLEFSEALIHAFIRTIPGERSFNARLIELVARAVHAIAVQLFNLEEKLHTESEIESTTTARDEPFILRSIGGEVSVRQSPLKKTLFFHGAYQDDHQYPHGIADTAAFWAEDRIFGGVFLFDRRETGTESNDVFLHSNRREWTYRVWRLIGWQIDAVVGLLTRNPDDTADSAVSPFPLYADEKNTYRFDAWDAMAWHHVYRDRWEREIAPTKNFNEVRRNSFDYPELRGFIEAMNGLPSLHKPIPHDGFSRDGPPGVNLPTWTFDMDAPVPRRPSTSVGSDTTDESTRSHKSEDGETDSQHAL